MIYTGTYCFSSNASLYKFIIQRKFCDGQNKFEQDYFLSWLSIVSLDLIMILKVLNV